MKAPSSELTTQKKPNQPTEKTTINSDELRLKAKTKQYATTTIDPIVTRKIDTLYDAHFDEERVLDFQQLLQLLIENDQYNSSTRHYIFKHTTKILIEQDYHNPALAFLEAAMTLAVQEKNKKKIWQYGTLIVIVSGRFSTAQEALKKYLFFRGKFNFVTPPMDFFIGAECAQINYARMTNLDVEVEAPLLIQVVTNFLRLFDTETQCPFYAELLSEIGMAFLFFCSCPSTPIEATIKHIIWTVDNYIKSFSTSDEAHMNMPYIIKLVHDNYFRLHKEDDQSSDLKTLTGFARKLNKLTDYLEMRYYVSVVDLHYTLNSERDYNKALRVFNRCWDFAIRSETDPQNVDSTINVFIKREIITLQSTNKQGKLHNHVDQLSAVWKFVEALPRTDFFLFILSSVGELYITALNQQGKKDEALQIFSIIYKHANEEKRATLTLLKMKIQTPGKANVVFSLGALHNKPQLRLGTEHVKPNKPLTLN